MKFIEVEDRDGTFIYVATKNIAKIEDYGEWCGVVTLDGSKVLVHERAESLATKIAKLKDETWKTKTSSDR